MNSRQAHSPASVGQELEIVLMNLSVMERRLAHTVESMRLDLIVLRERIRRESDNKKPGAIATG
ncbi:hypothetical protein [Paludibacterium purpuratum]|uniref:Uncharacterized protein n=1 Tax=Paludibacterium purpuratum TaxID=1144873 RepID=A0A4R7B5Q6_9NEIS|nr:hypothetical protein [Paludibacterium purpuratum]TDR80010.1 hypothetical protein DFP86_106150 [Paludibacterium purpuratum]